MTGALLRRILISLAMTVTGAVVSGGAVSLYPQTPPAAETMAVPETEAPETTAPETVPETTAPSETTVPETTVTETEPEPVIPEPGPTVYNFRFLFPENAEDTEDPLQSYGGKAFRDLYERDTDWQTSVFRYSTQRPANAAAALGIDRSQVMGKYNITDDKHNIDDPSTWDIGKWKNINVSITDGNGKANPVSSNVKEILAMASVYCWHNGIEDYDTFYSYAKKLWNASHSSSASIGQVYYDADDCLTQEQVAKAIRRGNGQHAEKPAASVAAAAAVSAGGAGNAEEAVSDATPGDAAAGEGMAADMSDAAMNDDAASAAIAAALQNAGVVAVDQEISGPGAALMTEAQSTSAETAAETSMETAAETAAESIVESAAEAAASEIQDTAAASAAEGGNTAAESADGQEAAASAEDGGLNQAAAESEAPAVDPAVSKFMKCPGHIDLTVKAVIYGLDGKKNLFTLDPVGGKKNNFNDNWQGWTEETMAEARALAEADWYADYGLSVSLFSKTSPLSESEIESYMELLPEDLSEDRRKLAENALGSIGRIPYYFGGKASSADYDKNHFGTLVGPDYKGRVFRGLDCSGWLAWNWWSTFGTPLSESSTGGLIHLGHEIRRKDLQTGDILVRAGGEETIGHVLMFFRWDEEGQAICIHETGGVTNNVVMTVQTDTGMSCRNLLD